MQLESVERLRGMHVAAAEASGLDVGSGAGGERVVCGFRVRASLGSGHLFCLLVNFVYSFNPSGLPWLYL